MPIIINPIINATDPTLQEKTITENGEYVADEGYDGLSKVKVNVESGASFNIHYGLNPPEDTSMLWVETESEPTSVIIDGVNPVGGEQLLESVGTLPFASNTLKGVGYGAKAFLFEGTSIYKYDSNTNETELLETVLPFSPDAGVAGVGKKCYGFSNTGTFIYDMADGSIEVLDAKLTAEYTGCAVGVVGTKVYLLGGRGGGVTKDIHVFDMETNELTKLTATLTNTCEKRYAAVVGTHIYLLAGSPNNPVYLFKTETNTCSTLGYQPHMMHGADGVTIGTKVYLFGGNAFGTYYDEIYEYDTEARKFTLMSAHLPTPIDGMKAVQIGTAVYLFGGYDGSTKTYLNSILKYEFTVDLDENTAHISATFDNNLFALINGENSLVCGVTKVFIGNAENHAKLVDAYLYNETSQAWELI